MPMALRKPLVAFVQVWMLLSARAEPLSALGRLRGGQWGDGAAGSHPGLPPMPANPQSLPDQQPHMPYGNHQPSMPYSRPQQLSAHGHAAHHNYPHAQTQHNGGLQPSPPQNLGMPLPQYGGGPLIAPGSSGAQGWQPAADVVRVSVRAAAGPISGQVDVAALPRLTADMSKLLRASQAPNGSPMLTTFSAVADSDTLQRSLRIPLVAMVQPLAVASPPIVTSSDGHAPTLARCRGCSAYLNAFARVDERSGRWECNLCGEVNELPLATPSAAPMQPQEGNERMGGGFFKGLWGSQPLSSSPPQPTQEPEPRADLRHDEVEYVLSTPESRQYSPADVLDALSPNAAAMPPRTRTMIIAIEVSPETYASGILRAYCNALLAALEVRMREDAGKGLTTRIGIITYGHHVQLYFLRPSLSGSSGACSDGDEQADDTSGSATPIAHVVTVDNDDDLPSIPRHTPTLVADLSTAWPTLRTLLSQIPSAPPDVSSTTPTSNILKASSAALPAAIHLALEALEGMPASVMVCGSAGATHGAGRSQRRLPVHAVNDEELSEYSDMIERLTRAEGSTVRSLARKCQAASVAVNICLAPSTRNSYVDLASLLPLATLTGGEVLLAHDLYRPAAEGSSHSSSSVSREDLTRVEATIARWIERPATATDAVFRVRTSTGLSVKRLIAQDTEEGNVVNLAAMQPHTTFAVEFEHEMVRCSLAFACKLP